LSTPYATNVTALATPYTAKIPIHTVGLIVSLTNAPRSGAPPANPANRQPPPTRELSAIELALPTTLRPPSRAASA
jgi:hypothetical protein